jgi:hypothetical protein
MDRNYGPWRIPLQFFGVNLSRWLGLPRLHEWSMNRLAYVAMPDVDDLVRNAWQFYNSNSYAVNSYMKPAVVLRSLENYLGEDTMARIMRTYHQRFRFHHPNSRDFEAVAFEVSGRDLSWFFDQFVFGSRRLDYSVGDVSSHEVKTPTGYFDRDGGKVLVSEEEAEKKDDAKNRRKSYDCTVKIRRLGDAVVPVEIVVHFKDGSQERRTWDGAYRWAKFTFLKPSEIEWVEIDPQKKWLLDVSYSNNSWQSDVQAAALAHWTADLLFWAQNLVIWMGALV